MANNVPKWVTKGNCLGRVVEVIANTKRFWLLKVEGWAETVRINKGMKNKRETGIGYNRKPSQW